VVTDSNHHHDPFSAAFDRLGYPITIDNARCLMMHAELLESGAKDWAAALDRLMKI
jgi:hypothetical protein